MKKKFKCSHFGLFACCFLAMFCGISPSFSQKLNSQAIFSPTESKITSAHFINDLHLDDHGLLWMATDQGIIRWDGIHKVFFDNHPGQKKHGLHGEKIVNIWEVSDQQVVLASETSPPGFEVFDLISEESNLIDLHEIKAPEENVIGVSVLKDQGFFAAIHDQKNIYIYQLIPGEGLVKISSQTVNFPLTAQRKFFTSNGKEHWIALENQGVYRLRNQKWERCLDLTETPFPEGASPKNLYCDQQGNLWFNLREQAGLWQAPAGQLALQKMEIPLQAAIHSIREDDQNNLVFIAGQYPAMLEEIWQWTDGKWTDLHWIIEQFPMATTIYAKDLESRIFVATPNNVYVLRQKNDQVKSYLKRSLQADEWGTIIKGIQEDQQGRIYFLSENDFLFRYDPRKKNNAGQDRIDTLKIPNPTGNGDFGFNCGGEIIRDQAGFFWFKICSKSSYSGILVRLDPKTDQWKLFPHEENFRSLDLEPGKGLWIGHHNRENIGSLSFFDFKSEQFTPLDSLGIHCRFPIPKYCYRGKDSIIWLGTTEGLGKINLRTKEFTLFTTENTALPDNHIIAIHQESEDLLLLGTHGGGLAIFRPSDQHIETYNQQSGLANDNVCGILPGRDGNYWLSTFNGISHFNRKLSYFTNFHTSAGFNYHEFNRYAFFKSSTGEFYFGNLNGANSFREEDLLEADHQNQVGISAIKIYFGDKDSTFVQNKGLRTLKKITLPYDFTYVQFDLFHTDYLQQEGQKVLTRLLGYDSEWEAVNPTKPLRYRNLRRGDYPLFLSAAQNVPQYLPAQPFLLLEVEPPFYLTWWFAGILIFFTLGGFWFWYVQRIARIRRQEAEKSATNLKFAELELQALQAQLNPHFIFNSLGAIQYFIKTNEKEKADGYLTSFARLMRLFLESSKNKYITLSEEIEMLGLYIDLERLRFKDRFSASITVDPSLDPAQIYLPSLLLQPFVENAINHGLFHKEGPGHLRLDFSPMENEGLLVTLEDNGIGRAKAREIKKRSVLNYKSRAMQIIDERREVLSQVEDYHIDIDIQDLTYPDGTPAGTKVVIGVPEIE